MFEALWFLPYLIPAFLVVLWIILKKILKGTWLSAAEWSAIAAFFAAISSFLMMGIQRENLMEAARPEIVLTDWTRSMEGRGKAFEIITFKTIRNVGHGAAFNLIINAAQTKNNRPLTAFSTTRLPVLSANESIDINGKIYIFLKNVEPASGAFKMLQFPIEILCWDSRNRRHETRYSLAVVEVSEKVAIVDEIAPGVSIVNRTTNIRYVWFLKMLDKLRRIPGVGKLFSEVRYLRHNQFYLCHHSQLQEIPASAMLHQDFNSNAGC